MKILRTTVVAAGASALIASLYIAPALATPGQGFMPNPIVNGSFGTLHVNTPGNKTDKWGLNLKTLDDTDIGADRLAIAPGGFSGWHAHPGPVFITVTQGSVVWQDGSGVCAETTYTVGQSFIEPAYGVHNVRNASASAGAEYVAITIKPEGFVGAAFRIDRPEPNNCDF